MRINTRHWNIFLGWLLLLVFSLEYSVAQVKSIPRDTSYTINSAYLKIKKKHPFVTPIKSNMPEGVRGKLDVVYSRINDRELHLDIFYPTMKRKMKYPGVLMIHGGGWISGSKEHQVPMAQQLAKNGFVAIAVEYRLSPEAQYPAAIHDLKASIRWMRAHATKYGLDENKIAVLGCSAGAQLAALVGTTNGIEKFEGSNKCLKYSSDVQAVVNIDGIVAFIHPESWEGEVAGKWLGGSKTERKETWIEASPLEHANENTPPFLFVNSSFPRFHAGRDDLFDILKKHNTYYEQYTLPESPHSFWLVHPWFEPTLKYTVEFLNKVFR